MTTGFFYQEPRRVRTKARVRTRIRVRAKTRVRVKARARVRAISRVRTKTGVRTRRMDPPGSEAHVSSFEVRKKVGHV